MLVLAYELAMQFGKALGFFKENQSLKNLADNFRDISENLKTVNDEYKEFAEVQKKLAGSEGAGFDSLIAQGNFFSNITGSITTAAQAMRDFKDENTQAQKTQKRLIATEKERLKTIAELEQKQKDSMAMESRGGGLLQSSRLLPWAVNTWDKYLGDGPDTSIFGKEQETQLQTLKKQQDELTTYNAGLNLVEEANKETADSIRLNTSAVIEYLQNLKERGPSQQKYLDALIELRKAAESGLPITQEQINNIGKLGKKFEETGKLAQHLKTQEKELQKQYTQAINGITKYSTSVSSLQKLIEDQIKTQIKLQKVSEDTKAVAESKAEVIALQKKLDVLEKIEDAEIRIANQRIKDQTIFNAALHGATALQKEQLTLAKKRLDNIRQIQNINLQIHLAEEEAENVADTKVEAYRLQKEQLIQQNELLLEQETLVFKIMDAGKQAFETGMSSAISKILKGEESSIKDALLGIGKQVAGSMIDAFSKKATTGIMNFLGMETDEQKQAKAMQDQYAAGALKLKTAHTDGAATTATAIVEAMDESAKKFAQAIKDACPSCTGGGDTPGVPGADDGPPGALTNAQIQSAMDNPGTYASSYAADGTGEGLKGNIVTLSEDTILKLRGEDPTALGAPGAEGEGNAALATFGGGGNGSEGGGDGEVPGGEGGEKEGLKGVMGKLTGETAKMVSGLGLAVASLAGNSKAAQAVQKVMAVMTVVTQAQTIFGKLKLLKDKLMGVKESVETNLNTTNLALNTKALALNTAAQATPGKNGIIPGYAAGGISRGPRSGYPAVLHGNEAVVPLPDGRSIPVSMPPGQGGGGMQTNNVGVTINMDKDGNASSETEGDSQELAQLGERVAMIVQEELVNQKRNGGILSPYGVA